MTKHAYSDLNQEAEILWAGVVRDGRTLLLMFIIPMDGKYHVFREDDPENCISHVDTEAGATVLADIYIAGFIAGYDKGVDHATKERTGHDDTYDSERKNFRRLRRRGRSSEGSD